MKKRLLVVFGLMALMLLSGCDSKVNDNGMSLDGLYGNASFTSDELSFLEKKLLPVSYLYTSYNTNDGSVSGSGEYTYLSKDKYLLPIEKYAVSREVSSSKINDGLVFSMVELTLEDGSQVSVLYINDPKTLRYSFATVYGEDETISYAFSY